MQTEYVVYAACLAGGVVIQLFALLVSMRLSGAVFRNVLLSFLAGLLVLAVSQGISCWILRGEWANLLIMAVLNLLIYGILAFLMSHFLLLGLCSLRLRILEVLDDSSEGLSLNALYGALGVEELTQRRLERLQSSGVVKSHDDRLYLGRSYLVLISNTILFLRRRSGVG